MRPFILPGLLILSILACEKPKNTSYLPDEYANPEITLVTLRDTLPSNSLSAVAIQELNGVRVSYPTGKYTCYFEYYADQNDMLKALNALPFDINTRLSDTRCRKMETDFSLSGKRTRTHQEIESSEFFWNIQAKEFTYYECLKTPMRHTLLFDKYSNRILHRIEFES